MLAATFLSMYDGCKRVRPAGECQEYVITAAPAAIKAYLGSYDACLRVFDQETCRKRFAQERGPVKTAFILGLGVGLLFLMMRR